MEKRTKTERIDCIVSVACTYLTEELESISKVYVFGGDGLLNMYPDTKSHDKAFGEYSISASYNWYFLNKKELDLFLEESFVCKRCCVRCKDIKELNSYMIGLLSYERYGDCNKLKLAEGYLYVATDMNLYCYVGSDEENGDLLFVNAEDVAFKENGTYKLYRNLDVIILDVGQTLGSGIYNYDYQVIGNNILLTF